MFVKADNQPHGWCASDLDRAGSLSYVRRFWGRFRPLL